MLHIFSACKSKSYDGRPVLTNSLYSVLHAVKYATAIYVNAQVFMHRVHAHACMSTSGMENQERDSFLPPFTHNTRWQSKALHGQRHPVKTEMNISTM